MASVTVSKAGARLVAVKRASGPAGEALRAEAELLASLQHPGLVELLDFECDGSEAVMRTMFVGGDTWASRPLTDPGDRAAGVAAVAATLADLHARSIAHGGVRGEHVIHGDEDRPVLCSLSRARRSSTNGVDAESLILADLLALADLIDDPPLDRSWLSEQLAELATQIRSGQLRSSDVVDAADLLARPTAGDPPDRPATQNAVPMRMRSRFIVVGVALAGLSTAVLIFGQRAEGPRPSLNTERQHAVEPAPGATTEPQDPTSAPIDSAPPISAGPPLDPVVSAGQPASPTPSSPPASLDPAAVVDHAGRRYRVGSEGDIVLLGDWGCQGSLTPAVVRLATGEIALFEGWPAAGESIEASAVWHVGGAHSATVESVGGCDQVRVHADSGSRLFDLRSAR